jgi:NDP-sugar pyrophosphorylase family protein
MFIGLHVIEESVLDLIPREGPSDIVVDVYRKLAAAGRLGAHVHRGFFWEFGRPALYLEGSRRLIDLPPERLAAISTEHDPIVAQGGARCALGPVVELASSARLGGSVALGFASKVGEDALVHDSIVMPEAWIGPGARLERVVVGPAVEIPARVHLHDVLVCADPGPLGALDGRSLPEDVVRRDGLLVRGLGA